MANGDLIRLDQHIFSVKLLDAQSASDNGTWIEIPAQYDVRSFWANITAEGSGSPKVDIMVSNAATMPANNVDDYAAHSLTAATNVAMATENYRWVKAKKTAGGTPVVVDCVVVASRTE